MKRIILASKSVDRNWILKQAGISFKVIRTNIDENQFKETITNPVDLVKKLASVKANSAKNKLVKQKMEGIIIAADTIVELNGEIIGKAKDEAEAFNILKKLTGKSHNLITGLAITETNNSKLITDHDITSVEFLPLTDEEIYDYIKTNEWKGRAGAYSIRDKASLFIYRIVGSSSNVIGLPMHKLYLVLKDHFNLNLFHI